MPLQLDDNLPTKFPDPDYLPLGNFKRGVITLINNSRLPKDALEQADNIFLVEDGNATPRPGVDYFGTAISSTSRGSLLSTITNLVTNPTLEINSTGWTTGGVAGASVARSTAQAYEGLASLKLTTTTSAGNQQATTTVTGLTIGQQYTMQAKIKGTVGQRVFGFTGFSGYSDYSEITLVSGWNTLSWTATATATSGTVEFGNFYIGDVYIDVVMCEHGSSASEYFDGSYADTTLLDYAWTGTEHASTSTKKIYEEIPAVEISGFDYFDYNGVIHLVATAGTKVYRSTDDGVIWTECTGATLTAGVDCFFNQDGGYLYITNGTDNMIRYNGTTTLQTYTSLPTPSAPTMSITGSLGTSGLTYYYKASAVNQIGFTAASTAGSITVTTPRDNWTTANYVGGTVPSVSGALRYDWYISEDGIDYFYLTSTVTNSFIDNNTAQPVASTLAPTQNTTQGEKYTELTSIGSRQFGVRNTNNRYRIGYTGGSPYSGAFASAYGGGYLDWQTGGKYIPVKAADYRDGKGTPLATIWCDSADGQGCILQMSLDEVTIADGITVIIPSAYKLPGSRGTPAPCSVINVLNDYYFYNSQAIYNIGNRPNLQQILSTDEMSANIRPTIKRISTSGEGSITTIYFDAKIYFSVPYGSDENNAVAIYDTERKAWLPYAFTIGFKKFLRYTDTSGNQRLLGYRSGDTQLSEISDSIRGDYGQAFVSTLKTGLYPVSKNRFEFQWTEEGEVEFSNPQGTVVVEVLGDERKSGFRSIKQKNISVAQANNGWDTFAWDTTNWDDTSVSVTARSESSVKRYFNIQKELNSIQWSVTTTTLDSDYILRTLQTWGTPTQGGKPRAWKLT